MDDIILSSKFEKAIRNGDIGEIKLLTKDESCDVNQIIGNEQDEEGYLDNERPLSLSLQNIKSENDKWFQISQLLLEHKNVDVNARCGKTEWCTVLGTLCGTKCDSTLGVEMLLEDSRTDVNGGQYTPLFLALSMIGAEDDYFYKIAFLLFDKKDIDVNHRCGQSSSTLRALI